MTTEQIRTLLRDNIGTIVETFDAHDPGIDEATGNYICPCGWLGPEPDWLQHLAEALGDKLTESTVELPEQLVLA